MAQSLQYPVHYIPPQSHYYISPHPQHPHVPTAQMHVVAPPARPEPAQRKRPKYTRSKTGCLTCRAKKIKCDETKPNCQRCTHGQRECTWPEGAPAKKKSPTRRKSINEDRPSTADSSSHVSDSPAASPEATHFMPQPSVTALSMPGPERRNSEPFVHSYPISSGTAPRRQTVANIAPHILNTPVYGGVPDLVSSYSSAAANPYSMDHATSHSVSSRSSSRPSTANSLPPSHYPDHLADSGHYHGDSLQMSNLMSMGHYDVSTPPQPPSQHYGANATWHHQYQKPQHRMYVGDRLPHRTAH